jgi:hypothetical protein
MIVFEDKWAFVSTRKCGTNSLYAQLPGRRADGPFHVMPKNRMADLHWSIVRNPYDRAVSIWASTSRRPGDKYWVKKYLGTSEVSFDLFVEKCLLYKNKRNLRDRFLFMNQVSWLETGLVDEVGRLETLEEDVMRFTGLKLNLGKENSSDRKSTSEYMTPEIQEMIEEWADEDFQEFNYERGIF